MDTIRSVFGKISGSGWVPWPPQASSAPAAPAPRDEVHVGATPSTPVAPRPWATLQKQGLVEVSASTTGVAAAVATGGPIGAVLGEECRAGLLNALRSLEQKGVRLAEHRIGETRPYYRPLSADEALANLEAQPAHFTQPLHVYTRDRCPVPLSSLTDVMVLDALAGPSGAALAPNPPLGSALRSLEEAGWTVGAPAVISGRPVHALHAYKTLSAGSQAIIRLEGHERSLSPHSADDVVAVDFFEGSRIDRGLSRPQVASTLRSLGEAGYAWVTVDARGQAADAAACEAYMALNAGSLVVVRPPQGRPAFFADEALLQDARAVQAREQEIATLYDAEVRPVLGDTRLDRPVDQAKFFDPLYGELSSLPRTETCRRLATLTKATFFSALPVFAEIRSAAATDGNIDGRITGFCRICKVGMPDADRLPAFHYLDRDLRRLAGSDAPYPALHETFLSLLERTHTFDLARKAVEICTLPVGNLAFEERADCLRQVAGAYDSSYQSQLIPDYLAIVTPRETSPLESAHHFAETFAPLRKALGRGAAPDSVQKAHDAMALVSIPVAGETQAQRLATLLGLVDQGCQDATEAYRSMLVHRVSDESLDETAERFSHVLAGLGSMRAQDRALDVFCSLQDAFRQDPTLDRDEVMSRFSEAAVLSSDVDAAVASALAPVRRATTITSEENVVTIGGIRIQRKM